MSNAIPFDNAGGTYYLGCRAGEVSSAVLLVSDYHLAERFAASFDTITFQHRSIRGYDTYTGTCKGELVSVVAFGLGFATIDFLIRELRAITEEPLTFIHVGVCASPADLAVGTAVIIRDAVAYQADFDNWDAPCPYQIFAKPVPAGSVVIAAIEAGLRFIQAPHAFGRAASSTSSAAEIAAPAALDFKTGGLLQRLTSVAGPIATLDMDTYPVLWTSRRAAGEAIWSGSVSLVRSNRQLEVLPEAEIEARLVDIAKVMLAQLAALKAVR
jgi:uridine phosphorylase